MYACDQRMGDGALDEPRERLYGFLAALMSHPDEGKWGRLLNGGEQRRAIAAADTLRMAAEDVDYPLGLHGLPAGELDLRSVVLELCQPLEHLKSEYERLFSAIPFPGCSPFELEHPRASLKVRPHSELAELYQSFGFGDGRDIARPDHIAHELEFMTWLIGHRRLALRIAAFDAEAKELAARCDLAQRRLFGDHLATWIPDLAVAFQWHPGGGYIEPLGRVLAAWMPVDRAILEADPGVLDRPTGAYITPAIELRHHDDGRASHGRLPRRYELALGAGTQEE